MTQFRIGALTSWTAIAEAPLPAQFYCLQAAAREVGGRQIQNRGTIGGNLCNASPAADGVPALLALGAEIELASRERQTQAGSVGFHPGAAQDRSAPG